MARKAKAVESETVIPGKMPTADEWKAFGLGLAVELARTTAEHIEHRSTKLDFGFWNIVARQVFAMIVDQLRTWADANDSGGKVFGE